MAGTQDQYLALAVSTAFTTKANVVGPISRYREYIQVPDVDDTTADPDSGIGGNSATVGEYTSALSTVPYSKFIYNTIPYFISNNKLGTDAIFFRQDTDYYLNSTPALKNPGDAYRGAVAGNHPSRRLIPQRYSSRTSPSRTSTPAPTRTYRLSDPRMSFSSSTPTCLQLRAMTGYATSPTASMCSSTERTRRWPQR
jgi:hypothetical protein